MKKNQIYLFIGIVLLFFSACDEPKIEYVAPKIWTRQPLEITNEKAVFTATFTKGSEEIKVFGFEWKETTEEEWETTHAQANTGSYDIEMTHLKEDVEYVVRAFIVDASAHKYFGEEKKFFTNGTLTDIDGNVYFTLRYGNKAWMTENLRVTRYADGTPIEGRSGGNNLDSDGPVCFHSGYHTPYFRKPNFGLLYNWAAAARVADCETLIKMSSLHYQGVCPDGWYLPSMGEWTALINLYGGYEKAGASMKTTTWNEPSGTSYNASRFSIEPAGLYFYMEMDGSGFRSLFSGAYFWSATQNSIPEAMGLSSYAIALVRENSGCHTLSMRKCTGYSVRCVKELVIN